MKILLLQVAQVGAVNYTLYNFYEMLDIHSQRQFSASRCTTLRLRKFEEYISEFVLCHRL